MERKYECINETITVGDKTLYRIKALMDFGDVKKGDLGGYIENEDNLSHKGKCWVYGDARVFGNAQVSGDAWISGDAKVFGNAQVCGDARVFGNAKVFGDAQVSGDARISGNAKVSGKADVSDNACVSGNAWVIDDACIYNNAKIYNNAYITNINDYIVIGPIGGRNEFATFYLTKDKEIMVSYFTDPLSIDDFITKVDKLDEPYKTRCLLAVEFGKKVFENNIKN